MENAPTTIDSLNAKIILMQNEISSLKGSKKAISDSLTALNKTIEKADIATTFYDTHLATYTVIFTVLISLIITGLTLYNIFGIYKPIQNKINNIKEVEIPELSKQIREQSEKEIYELKNLALDGMDWSLKSMMNHYENIGDSRGFILFCFRYIEFLIDYEIDDDDHERILAYLRYTKLIIERDEISITSLSEYEDEITKIISAILRINNEEVIELALNSKSMLFKRMTIPSTALDIVKSDELIPLSKEPSQPEEPPMAEPE